MSNNDTQDNIIQASTGQDGDGNDFLSQIRRAALQRQNPTQTNSPNQSVEQPSGISRGAETLEGATGALFRKVAEIAPKVHGSLENDSAVTSDGNNSDSAWLESEAENDTPAVQSESDSAISTGRTSSYSEKSPASPTSPTVQIQVKSKLSPKQDQMIARQILDANINDPEELVSMIRSILHNHASNTSPLLATIQETLNEIISITTNHNLTKALKTRNKQVNYDSDSSVDSEDWSDSEDEDNEPTQPVKTKRTSKTSHDVIDGSLRSAISKMNAELRHYVKPAKEEETENTMPANEEVLQDSRADMLETITSIPPQRTPTPTPVHADSMSVPATVPQNTEQNIYTLEEHLAYYLESYHDVTVRNEHINLVGNTIIVQTSNGTNVKIELGNQENVNHFYDTLEFANAFKDPNYETPQDATEHQASQWVMEWAPELATYINNAVNIATNREQNIPTSRTAFATKQHKPTQASSPIVAGKVKNQNHTLSEAVMLEIIKSHEELFFKTHLKAHDYSCTLSNKNGECNLDIVSSNPNHGTIARFSVKNLNEFIQATNNTIDGNGNSKDRATLIKNLFGGSDPIVSAGTRDGQASPAIGDTNFVNALLKVNGLVPQTPSVDALAVIKHAQETANQDTAIINKFLKAHGLNPKEEQPVDTMAAINDYVATKKQQMSKNNSSPVVAAITESPSTTQKKTVHSFETFLSAHGYTVSRDDEGGKLFRPCSITISKDDGSDEKTFYVNKKLNRELGKELEAPLGNDMFEALMAKLAKSTRSNDKKLWLNKLTDHVANNFTAKDSVFF